MPHVETGWDKNEVSTSYPKGNGANGKNWAQRRSKKPTLVKGVQYHKL
jgi:hypothetical protein